MVLVQELEAHQVLLVVLVRELEAHLLVIPVRELEGHHLEQVQVLAALPTCTDSSRTHAYNDIYNATGAAGLHLA